MGSLSHATYRGEVIKRMSADGTCVEKRCSSCHRWKPFNEEHYYWNPARASLQSQCIECQSYLTAVTKAIKALRRREAKAAAAEKKDESNSSCDDSVGARADGV